MRFVLLLALCLMAWPASAHDYERPDLMWWFKTLTNKAKTPCCDGAEAKHVSDPDWRSADGHYEVRIKGQWLRVPDSAVIDSPNLFGPTLVWLSENLQGIRCFLPGSGT